MSRKEELEAELSALTDLERIENRRERALQTHTNAVHRKYDEQRRTALLSVPKSVQEGLTKTDPAHRAFLEREGELVDDADIETLES